MAEYALDFPNTKAILLELRDAICEKYSGDVPISSGRLSEVVGNVIVNGMSVQIVLDLQHYWKYVEYGRKAYGMDKRHWPPIAPIRE